ncbi:FAD-dependent monooxygenase [Aurantibacter sp.]|uniref:FAD-dependent monooxygenase n=1 Tax=Aurantibacter sp. TaxID=2807103 RepID=UPI0035C7D659
MSKVYNVGIIGGGVSGAVIALELAKYGIENILLEKEESLVNSSPFCHLHAGGNLYPDISTEQCKVLMKQSIAMARLFPQSIDQRPTFISIPKSETYKVSDIQNRLNVLVDYYKTLIKEDPKNKILGSPEDYYNIFTKEDLNTLVKQPTVTVPKTANQWITNALKLIDYTQLKTPIILVQEYGWNFFRLGAQAQLALNKATQCNLQLNTNVSKVEDVKHLKLGYNWKIHTKNAVHKVKYLVNSCGFKTGEIDTTLNLNTKRLIEFKAAYVSKWQPINGLIPELIFHGKRGTPNGMVQLTPYCNDYYQIHGMTKDVTLFDNGLIQSKTNQSQPEFNAIIKEKLKSGWKENDIEQRTKNAISNVTKFIPTFKSAIPGSKPLYGAQQIPGDDPILRVGEVSFPSKFYARSEIIKASSALTVANQIIYKIQEEAIIPTIKTVVTKNVLLNSISKNDINALASKLATQRGYPNSLAKLVIDRD